MNIRQIGGWVASRTKAGTKAGTKQRIAGDQFSLFAHGQTLFLSDEV
jgi:hypothetical protein